MRRSMTWMRETCKWKPLARQCKLDSNFKFDQVHMIWIYSRIDFEYLNKFPYFLKRKYDFYRLLSHRLDIPRYVAPIESIINVLIIALRSKQQQDSIEAIRSRSRILLSHQLRIAIPLSRTANWIIIIIFKASGFRIRIECVIINNWKECVHAWLGNYINYLRF